MKKGDYVKIKKMKKTHVWYEPFGVLFTGLQGKLEGITHHKDSVSYFVTFTAKRGLIQMSHFAKSEIKLIYECPVCEDMEQPKQNIKQDQKLED